MWQSIHLFFDDHLTKFLGVMGTSLVLGDVTSLAEPLKYVLGEIGYKLLLGAVCAATIWRGVVVGEKHEAMLEELASLKNKQQK